MKSKYILLLFFLFVACSKKNENHSTYLGKDLEVYLKIASNDNFTYAERKKYNLKAENIILNQKKDNLDIEKLFKVANNYFLIYDLNKYKSIIEIIYKNCLRNNDREGIANSDIMYGKYYEMLSKNSEAFKYYLKAEKYFKTQNNYIKLTDVYYSKGLLQFFINDYLGSEISLIECLRLSRKNKLYEQEYKSYIMIAIISADMKNFDKAFEYNLKALKLSKKSNNNVFIPYNHLIFHNLGDVYLKMKRFRKALNFFELTLEEKDIFKKDPQTYTYTLDKLAYSNFKLKNYTHLPQLYFRAAKIRDSLNINQGQNYNRLYLSEYYAAIKDTVKSSQYAHEAYALSKEYKAPNDMLQVLKQLSKIEPQHALKYSNDYIRISDSVYQLERETRNKFAKIAFETEEITQEKDTALTHKSIYSGIALAVFLVGFLIFIIIHQKNKHKEMFFLQQQQKNNDEIYQLIQLQHHKVEEARLIEKQRIAQELHDGIMNKLAYTRFNLHLLTKKNDDKAFSKCATYIDGIQDIEKEIRDIAHDLNNHVFSKNSSFKNALITLFNEQKEIIKAKFHIELNDEINWELLKENVKIHIFRMFQELLQNIAKHAKSNNVIISATINKEILFLEVYDDGEGFSLKGKKKGIGLQNIYARVKQCGGAINIISNKGQGTKVIIKLPIQKEIKIV